MSSSSDMAERHGRTLADLAERGHALACRIQEDAMAAESPAERAELSVAFHRVCRSVRQSMALEAKLERDRRLGERERREQVAREVEARVQARKARAKTVLERMVWSEAEGEEADLCLEVLDDLIDEDALGEDFLADPVEAYIARLRYDLCLDEAPADAAGALAKPRGLELAARPGRRRRARRPGAGAFDDILGRGWRSG